MNENFDRAFRLLMQYEGGYVNNPNDPGGETKYGISKRTYPDLDIPNLTEDQAKEIYRRDFWLRCGCDLMAYPMDCIAFDTSVLCGVNMAAKFVKESRDWKDYLFRRLCYHVKIAQANPKLREFFRGWAARVVNLWMQFRQEA